MVTRNGSHHGPDIDERQSRLVAREQAQNEMREGGVSVVVGCGIVIAGFLYGNPLPTLVLGIGAVLIGAFQFYKGYAALQEAGAEPPEPVLDLREHPVTLAPVAPTPIVDTAHDAAKPAWIPWSIAAAVVLLVLSAWWVIWLGD